MEKFNKTFLSLPLDARFLFLTRTLRLFAYGFLSVILVLYLTQLGLTQTRIGLLLSLTLFGDTVISFCLTMAADTIGRKRMLEFGALLMILAGILFVLTNNFLLLLLAATIGVISPSGNEIGPFLAIEQASLSHTVSNESRTRIFAWYNLAGSLATACGALVVGLLAGLLIHLGVTSLNTYRFLIAAYAVLGSILWFLFSRLSTAIEADQTAGPVPPLKFSDYFRLGQSRGVILKLSSLFALDAFGGGFIVQSVAAYWFYARFHAQTVLLGAIFFGVNLLAGFSALLAARLAYKIGLIRTMVFTHIPSNILLMLVPWMPNLGLAIFVYLLRSSISQMDVPTRQSYTMAVVSPRERSQAGGITNIARTLGAACAPIFVGPLLADVHLLSRIFFLAGGIKIIYDVILYFQFKHLKPPEERV